MSGHLTENVQKALDGFESELKDLDEKIEKAAGARNALVQFEQEHGALLQKHREIKDAAESSDALEKKLQKDRQAVDAKQAAFQQELQKVLARVFPTSSSSSSTSTPKSDMPTPVSPEYPSAKKTRISSSTASVPLHISEDLGDEAHVSKELWSANANGYTSKKTSTQGFKVTFKDESTVNVLCEVYDRVYKSLSREASKLVQSPATMRSSVAKNDLPSAELELVEPETGTAGRKPKCAFCKYEILSDVYRAYPLTRAKCTIHPYHVLCGVFVKLVMIDEEKCFGYETNPHRKCLVSW